jgi:hypothetical protein
MTWHVGPRTCALAAVAASLVLCTASTSRAGEARYCVTCKNPDQTYVCKVSAGGARPSDALKLYCIIRTAKEGHHATCSAERESSACNGVEKIYSYDGPLPEDLAADPRIKNLTDRIRQEQKVFDKPEGGDAPKTLVELTGRAVSASRRGLRNARSALGGSPQSTDQSPQAAPLPSDQSPVPLAGDAPAEALPADSADASQPNRVKRAGSAVGGFARKGYRCVLSLFRNCSNPDDGSPQ